MGGRGVNIARITTTDSVTRITSATRITSVTRQQRMTRARRLPSPVDADARLAVDGLANASLRPRLPLFVFGPPIGVLSVVCLSANPGFDRVALPRFADGRASSASSTDRIESGVSYRPPEASDDILHVGETPTDVCIERAVQQDVDAEA